MKIIIIVSRSQFVNAWVDCNRLFEATPVPVFNSGILPLATQTFSRGDMSSRTRMCIASLLGTEVFRQEPCHSNGPAGRRWDSIGRTGAVKFRCCSVRIAIKTQAC
jgi:hypothetical protein